MTIALWVTIGFLALSTLGFWLAWVCSKEELAEKSRSYQNLLCSTDRVRQDLYRVQAEFLAYKAESRDEITKPFKRDLEAAYDKIRDLKDERRELKRVLALGEGFE